VNNLIKLIGLAPSEMTREELMNKLISERNRVQSAIAEWRSNIALKPVKQPKEKKARARKQSLKEFVDSHKHIFELAKSLNIKI